MIVFLDPEVADLVAQRVGEVMAARIDRLLVENVLEGDERA